jgi:hypothetical protein
VWRDLIPRWLANAAIAVSAISLFFLLASRLLAVANPPFLALFESLTVLGAMSCFGLQSCPQDRWISLGESFGNLAATRANPR